MPGCMAYTLTGVKKMIQHLDKADCWGSVDEVEVAQVVAARTIKGARLLLETISFVSIS